MDKRTLPAAFVVFLLSATWAMAANPAITGPDKAAAGQYVTLSISGLSTDALARAKVSSNPSESVSCIPATTWGGQPILLFMASQDGEYEIRVEVNGFVQAFKVALDEARNSQVDSKTLELYRSLDSVLAAEYPRAHCSHAITVGKPPKPDPPVPTPDKVQLLIVEESGQRLPPYGDLFIALRRSDTLRDVELIIADRDGKTPDGRPTPNIQAYLDLVDGNLPFLFVIGEVGGTKGKILWQGTCPPHYSDVLGIVGKFRKVD